MYRSFFPEAFLGFGPFDPGPFLLPLGVLYYCAEDVTTISVQVNPRMDILRHGYEPRYVGIQFWLGYDTNLLLPAQ